MDLDQLRTFLEIVRLKSFSKAAQTCFRTQPAISAQVRQLEQELNCQLFDRLGTRIALTPAGRIFAEYAEQILDLRRRAQDAIAELEHTPKGELTIAANEAICIYVLPEVFSEYKKRFPNVQVQVERSYSSQIIENLVNNQADFGIIQMPCTERKLQIAPIYSDEVKVIVPPGHELASKEEITPRDLLGHPLLLPKTGGTRAKLDEWLEPVENELQISMELDATEMTKRFVMAGVGISFLAASNCREEVEAGKLATISMGPEPMIRRLALAYRRDKSLSKAALGFIDVILTRPGAPKNVMPEAVSSR
jgi:DNA-binding transcriptional LysR family regulator